MMRSKLHCQSIARDAEEDELMKSLGEVSRRRSRPWYEKTTAEGPNIRQPDWVDLTVL